MINAVEAREKAKQRLDEIVESQLQEIEKLVLGTCENGDFCAFYDESLKDETVKILTDLGYNVEDDKDCKIIDWEFIDDNPEPVQDKEETFTFEEYSENEPDASETETE